MVPVLPYRLEDLGYDNIASLTSWLLFAYSAGIFVGTFPTAWFFHRYPVRRGPLVAAVLIMIGSCILFMLPNNYTAMVISRVIQGLSSCIVWTGKSHRYRPGVRHGQRPGFFRARSQGRRA